VGLNFSEIGKTLVEPSTFFSYEGRGSQLVSSVDDIIGTVSEVLMLTNVGEWISSDAAAILGA